jgi:uncharacterized coiled-coil DUF342 family protein
MNQEAKEFRENIDGLENKLKQFKGKLNELIRNCKHTYRPVVYDPIITEAYTIPGDPPGTMGVDWRGPIYVPREERLRWKRECAECGFVEYTEQIKEKIERIPSWPKDFHGGKK